MNLRRCHYRPAPSLPYTFAVVQSMGFNKFMMYSPYTVVQNSSEYGKQLKRGPYIIVCFVGEEALLKII